MQALETHRAGDLDDIRFENKIATLEKKVTKLEAQLSRGSMLVSLKQTIVAIRMRVEVLMELGATQQTLLRVGSLVVFLHVAQQKPTAKLAILTLGAKRRTIG